MKPNQYEPGEEVMAMNDLCEWVPATIIRVRASYQYTVALPAGKFFKGGEVPSVWFSEDRIRMKVEEERP